MTAGTLYTDKIIFLWPGPRLLEAESKNNPKLHRAKKCHIIIEL